MGDTAPMNTPALLASKGPSSVPVFPQCKAFVLQFSPEAGPQTGLFRGRVEHLSSGNHAVFQSTEELWAFVRNVLVRPVENVLALPARRERAA